MSSSVLGVRVKEPNKRIGNAIIERVGSTPSEVVNGLYSWIVETGTVPPECLRYARPRKKSSYEKILEASEQMGVHATGPDMTPEEMHEALYG